MLRSNKKKNKPSSKIPSSPPYSVEKPNPSQESSIEDNIPSFFLGNNQSLIVRRAIVSAARHGIDLVPGRPNPATGNCAFEATIFNINDRQCFNEKLTMSADFYRRIWCTDMKNRSFDSSFNPRLSRLAWNEG